jgi:hypothetical protein
MPVGGGAYSHSVARASEIVKAVLHNDTTPDLPSNGDLGAWSETIDALLEAHTEGGQDAARRAWAAMVNADPALGELLTEDHNGPPLQPYIITGDYLLTTDWPEPIWAIPDLLPVGLTFLAGRPKTGKSWLALQIAQSVATGGVVFSREVERGPILYLALEDPPRRLAERMKKQSWPLGTDSDFMTLGDFVQQVGDLRNGGGDNLAEQIEQRGYRFVVIDTLSRAVVGDQLDEREMKLCLAPIQVTAQNCNCSVVIVDHHRKNGNSDVIDDPMGHTAKTATADTVWGLYRERGKFGAELQITGREIAEQTLSLTFDATTGCWQCEGDTYGLKITERRQEILDALETLGRGKLAEIVDYVGQPKSNTHNRLQDLTCAGLIVRTEDDSGVWYALP